MSLSSHTWLPPLTLPVALPTLTAIFWFIILSAAFHKGIRERIVSIVFVWPFFTRRYDFLVSNFAKTGRNFFSFKVMQHTVTAVRGEEARKAFYNDKGFSILDGYALLTGGANLNMSLETQESVASFNKVLAFLLNKQRMSDFIPFLFDHVQSRMDSWGKEGQIDPFNNVYEVVFQLTVGMTTCRELLENLGDLKRLQSDYFRLEKSATPAAVLFPWLPGYSQIRRIVALKNLYFSLLKYVKMRRAAPVPSSDAIDLMLTQGKTDQEIIGVVIGVIFAGVVNTGVSACWILLYMAYNKEWKQKIYEEVMSLVHKHTNSTSAEPLHKRLAAIPVSVWEDETPVLEAVLRETLRMAINGTTLRRNVVQDLDIQGEVISRGHFLAYSQADAHMNSEIYSNPTAFDPERFSPDRLEDKNQTHAFLGWGAGRHPCTGMKTAKLEIKVIVALFVAGYEFDIVDSSGQFPKSLPRPNHNDIHQPRPVGEPCFLKFKRVVE
ncbi:cytochrome P450 [Tricholoma matsutake]|nr:cytochrome P450 [Tricholoma matsutake 945]